LLPFFFALPLAALVALFVFGPKLWRRVYGPWMMGGILSFAVFQAMHLRESLRSGLRASAIALVSQARQAARVQSFNRERLLHLVGEDFLVRQGVEPPSGA